MARPLTSLFAYGIPRIIFNIFIFLILITTPVWASDQPDEVTVAAADSQQPQPDRFTGISSGYDSDLADQQPAQIYLVINIYLPLVERLALPDNQPEDEAQVAIERVNYYRSLAGVASVHNHTTVLDAAQNHANYHMANYADPSAWEFGVHGEVGGKPGYTGKWPYDRMKAAEYPWFGSAEVMHFLGDALASVDGWMSTVYHRVVLLEPSLTCAGYGSGSNNETAVDVMNLGIGAAGENLLTGSTPYPLAYPTDRQEGVPVEWNGSESPDPLPAGVTRPVGYPFTLQGVMGKLVVEWAEMRDGDGQTVAVHPNPPLCPEFNCFAMIPIQPLSARMTYTVSAQGSVDGVAFSRSWSFTTGDSILAGELTGSAGERVGPSMLIP